MIRIMIIVGLCITCFIFYQCKHTTEPIQQNVSVSGITETGTQGPMDFVGALDLNDWDPASYEHLTIKQNYWVDKAVTDTISISGGIAVPLKIHNLSQTILKAIIAVSVPFQCSNDSVSIQGGQTETLSLTVDTNLVGNDTLIVRQITITVFNEQLHYVVGWAKPRNSGGIVVVEIARKDCLYPAYPNPANGYFAFSYSISTDRTVCLYVLNDKLVPVDTLENSYKKAGTHIYYWLTTTEQQAKFQAGYYRVVLQTDAYSRSGDILLSKQ